MAIHGQVFRSAQAAIASIDQVTGAVARQARQASMGGPQSLVGGRFPGVVELARIDDAAFEGAARRAFADLAWIDDKWCSGRSLVTGQLLADSARRPLAAGLVGTGPRTDAIAGAVGIVDGPFRFQGGGWSYHAVGVGWPNSSPVPLAIDGALFTRPVPLAAWARRIGARAEDVRLRHPWDLRGLGIADSLDVGVHRARSALVESVHEVDASGAPIDNPFLRGVPIERVSLAVDDAGRGAAYTRRYALPEPW